jgi:hypothetical protein
VVAIHLSLVISCCEMKQLRWNEEQIQLNKSESTKIISNGVCKTKLNFAFYNIFMCVHTWQHLKLLDVVQVILTDEVFLYQTSRKQRTAYELSLNRPYNTAFIRYEDGSAEFILSPSDGSTIHVLLYKFPTALINSLKFKLIRLYFSVHCSPVTGKKCSIGRLPRSNCLLLLRA